MKNIYSYRKRAFLNPVSTNHTSYIFVHVESSRGGEYKFGSNLIHLADCDRRVQIEFFLGTEQDREISLKKINLLIETLTRFRDALAKESELIKKGE